MVVDTKSPCIIGLRSCESLNLVKRVYVVNDEIEPDILNDYPDTFGGIGCLPGQYKIKVDPNVDPVIEPPRRIPFALKGKVKAELDRMEKLNVIQKVSYPTDWVSNIVVVEKKQGSIRLCLDPKNLNRAIKREHFHLPTIEDIMARMPNAKVFSKLDASSGYWQIEVDDKSADLLTFNTPFGRYRFNRLPFGVWSASEIFGKSIYENIVEGLEGVANIQDDIIVWGSTKVEHDQRLQGVLERIRKANLKLNKDKCQFGVNELKFVGHVFSGEGVKADPEKIEAILQMPSPQDKTELRRFMGMINYLGKFVPNLSDITAPLRQLLEKDFMWTWSDKHEECIELLKKLVTESPVLKYYDPTKPMKLSVDSSKYGLGAVLLQKYEEDWAPVAYGSRSLTRSERNYAQIEKESLAILFGCNKFNDHLYGVHFTVESDHQPLQSIFKRSIVCAPQRIQCFLLRLQKYDFEVIFSPGKNLVVSDTLSRAPLQDCTLDEKDVEAQIHMLFEGLPVSDDKLEMFKKETINDTILQKLKEFTINGWSDNKSNVPSELRPYYSLRSEITVANGLLFKNDRIIVPTSMRKEMKERIHEGHLGQEKCKARARQVVFWPGMNAEIIEMVAKCSTCLEHRSRQQNESLMSHEVPNQPWEKVGADLFEFKHHHYLVCVDYYSNYPEVTIIGKQEPTSAQVISHLKSIFSRLGISRTLVSDNGPQFSSQKFKEFLRHWEIQHDPSSPHFPKANGMAESAVKSVKALFKKAHKANEDPYLALLNHRATPSTTDGLSPARKLMNREPITRLSSMKPSVSNPNNQDTRMKLQAKKEKQKEFYDRKAKDLPTVPTGSTVRLHDGKFGRKRRK